MSTIFVPGSHLASASAAAARPGQEAQAVLDAEVMPTLAALKLDLSQAKAIGSKGDLLLFRAYKDFGMGARPAMLLARRRDPATSHVWFPLESLWIIREGDQAVSAAMKIANQIYGFATKDDAHRVLDCLFEFAEDLVRTPPDPRMTARQWLDACEEDGLTVTHSYGPDANG
jgi:hypothetical protein